MKATDSVKAPLLIALGLTWLIAMSADIRAETVTWEFTFSSAEFSFDFGTSTTTQVGHFSYNDVLVPVFNGFGYRVVDFQLDGLFLGPGREVYWVPQPQFDNTTIQILPGIANDDTWDLFDQAGTLRFQLAANPDGLGGFNGEISENSTGAARATVTFHDVVEIPAASEWGILAMTLLILATSRAASVKRRKGVK